MKRFFLILLIPALQLSAQISNTLSTADKIYGLSKFWQEVNYNFIYLNKTGKARWDIAYREYIVKVQDTKSDFDYYREMQKFCALLKDGHTNIYFPQKREFELMNTMFGDYRLFLQNIDGKAIVVRTNLSRKNEIPLGSEVIEVNGLSTPAYISQYVAPYISSSTDYVLQDWSIGRLLQGREGDKYTVKIRKPKGELITLQLTHKTTAEKDVFPPFEQQGGLLELKWYDNQVAYLALNSFSDPAIDSLFLTKLPELYKAKGLIIDLRYNGGGSTNIGTDILQYLTNDKLLYGARSISRQHIPTYKAWGVYTSAKDTVEDRSGDAAKCLAYYNDNSYYYFEYQADSVKLDARRLVVPTVILLGHETASAAEDFLIYADNQKHMIKMGQNSFGSTGQPYKFDLPGGGSARVCTKKDVYPDGREFVGYGIKPDIEVNPTLEDYLQKRDPALAKAREYLKEKVK